MSRSRVEVEFGIDDDLQELTAISQFNDYAVQRHRLATN